MPFIVIAGEFVPEAGRPDGDSVRFRPDTPDLILHLRRRGRPPKINPNNGTIQLRFEGIDTMESRALDPFSADATSSNLELCGVPNGQGTARGHILSNQLGPNGRPIAFVFSGDADENDGDEVFLDANRMTDSVNFAQIERGHAYPLFYDTLFGDLRGAISDATDKARTNELGVWTADETNSGVLWGGPDSVESMKPIFPKLWRRLDSYSRDSDILDNSTLDEFLQYIEIDKAERVFILPEARSTGFDDVLSVNGNTVSMTFLPEELIFNS